MNIIYHVDATPLLASFRYRVTIPGEILKARGYGVRILHDGTWREGEPQVHLFLKHFRPMDRKIARRMVFDGHTVIFDICDDHFHKISGDYYREMCQTAHLVTCNSNEMHRRILAETGRSAFMIPDPYELPEAPARTPSTHPLLVWFGHPVNFDTLPPLLKLDHDLDLVTANTVPYPLNDHQRVIPYTHDALIAALAKCDLVVLPTLDLPHKRAKSANRVIESLRAGRFVVAGPHIPAYEDFREFIWIGDLAEGIDYATHHPEEIHARIVAGQEYIRDRYSPERIADQWEFVMRQVASGVRHQNLAGVDQRGHEGMERGSATGSP